MFGWARELKAEVQVISLLLLLAVSTTLLSGVRLNAQGQYPARLTATSSLTLIQSTDPAFDGTLDTYFPGVSELANYQGIRPFLVLVQNNAGLTAVAYAIEWHLQYGSGGESSFSRKYITSWLTYRPAVKAIRPQQTRLISPLFNLNAAEYRNRYAAQPGMFTQIYAASRFPSSPKLSSVSADVDGVVYSDGSFIGPDKTRIWERYLASRDAEHDEALAALTLLNGSATPIQFEQALAQDVARAQRQRSADLVGMYVRARGRSAQDIKRLFASRGSTWLQNVLDHLISTSRAQGQPTPLGAYF